MEGKPTSREDQSNSTTRPPTGSGETSDVDKPMPSTSQLNITDEDIPLVYDFTHSHISKSNVTVWELKLLFMFLFETFTYNLMRLFQVSGGKMLTCFQIEEDAEKTYETIQYFTIIYICSERLTFKNIKYFYSLYDAVYHKLKKKSIRNFIVFTDRGLSSINIESFGMEIKQRKESRILGSKLFDEDYIEVYSFEMCSDFNVMSLSDENSDIAPSYERVKEFFDKLLIYSLRHINDDNDITPLVIRKKYNYFDDITDQLIEKAVQELVTYASSGQTQKERNNLSEALKKMLPSSSSPPSL